MRTHITAALALATGLATAPAHAQTFVAEHGALKVQGNRIVDSHGQPITLRGMALYWSQWKPAFYNAACLKWLRDDWKCTVVRASMAVGNGGYLTNPSGEMNKVRAVVQAAIDLGIYVIVDFHETNNAMDHLAQAKTFFGAISKEFGSAPNLIYETWNEPLNTQPWATIIKPYHEAVIPVIRANAPGNVILCGTRSWSQDVDEASKNPITIDKNVAYTLHFYAATHKAPYRAKAQTALNNGIALMVTEGGLSEATGNGALDTAEAKTWCDFLDQNGIAWMSWSIADLSESSAALRPGASGSGGWATSQLSVSGNWCRNRIRANARALSLSRAPGKPARYPLGLGASEAARDANGRLRVGLASGPGEGGAVYRAAGAYFSPLP